ncbi:MAG: hypothetical protein ACOYXU_09390 [Nitrospirota bacterium]
MLEKAKELGRVLFGTAILIALLALPVVFIKGSLWAAEHLLPPLIRIGAIALVLNILVLLPLSLFKSLRGFTGTTIYLSSFVFGLVTWLLGFVLTYVVWGLWAVIVGILLLGGGVVPIALLATLFDGSWEPFFGLLIFVVVTFGARGIGLFIAQSASE